MAANTSREIYLCIFTNFYLFFADDFARGNTFFDPQQKQEVIFVLANEVAAFESLNVD